MKIIHFIYYMRLLAVILIVNSHFNPKRIIDFEPFAFYGYLGNLGNMIFFFISAYILTLGFDKYRYQKGRWVIYRLVYLILIILTLRFVFESVETRLIQNPFWMFIDLFIHIDFISVMLYLSAAFPLMYAMSRKSRLTGIGLLFIIMVSMPSMLPNSVINLVNYVVIFLLGIAIANGEIRSPFRQPAIHLALLVLFGALFILAKLKLDTYSVTNPCKIGIILSMFFLLKDLDLGRVPSRINVAIQKVAELSLYIYLTHFYFVNLAYQMNKYLGLVIVFIIVFPICYVEDKLLSPVIRFFRRRILKPG